MCGIAGKIDFGGPVEQETVARMCALMEHRGPDSRGVRGAEGAAIGAQRLAIIDVAHGDQPVTNEDGSVIAALNGEIYNFAELRERLVRAGHSFRSHVDTEVLAHLYEEHGERMVDQLRGMFAFAIWDTRRRQLLLARDRPGKKPLFWARRGDRVWFASEVRALFADPELRPEVEPRAIDAYLALQYVPHPLSAFRGVHKLPPATTLSISADGEREERYWSLDYTAKVAGIGLGFDDAKERVRAAISEATRIRLMSEVPLGAFLSGGVDSSAIVACMAEHMSEPVKTFSIGFPEREFDELEYARKVAERFGTEHREFVVEPDALSIMPKLARHYGEPYADPSAIPSFYLSELTKQHVTVALNGDGGDESFAGYSRYRANRLLGWLRSQAAPLRAMGDLARRLPEGARDNSARARVRRLAGTAGMSPAERYLSWMTPFDDERRGRLLRPEFAASLRGSDATEGVHAAWSASRADDLLDVMLDVDVHTYLPDDLLVKIDIATMAYSVEARSPLLDHEVMELAASLPADYKLGRGGVTKHVLKEAFRADLPDDILDRPKKGFGVPLRHWFRDELRDMPREMLLDPGARTTEWLRREEVERLIDEHRDERADHSLRLWTLLQLETWHREVVDAAAPDAVGSRAAA
jgi:asparagine synthase (glutamine-hydrolysing)